MDIALFRERFASFFPTSEWATPLEVLKDTFLRCTLDPCPDVPGMSSLKKQRLLQIAYGLLPEDEAYLEVGTFLGKSVISAALGNPQRKTYACDNFSEFDQGRNHQLLLDHLRRHRLADTVKVFNADFRSIANSASIPEPIGVYFYDGAHDEVSQFEGIALFEPLLADQALVIVDDWRLAPDSQSFAKLGTERAIAASPHDWTPLMELPARYNGDHALWWNGVAAFGFQRR